MRLRGGSGADAAIHHLPDPPVPGGGPGQWWPPPALTTDWLDDHASQVDLVHLHFGFDARTPEQLSRWSAALDAYDIPLVLTVHDIVNPHFVDQTEHLARLTVLVRQAAEVVTLTTGAAGEIRRRWGRRATVLPHPHVAPLALIGHVAERPRDRFRIGLHLKSLRANVAAAPVVRALAAAAEPLPDAEVTVHLHREVVDPDHPRHDADLLVLLSGLHDDGRISLTVHDPQTDAELWDYLLGLDLSVLPYAFGTHSGWLEACFDLGTAVLAPRTGFWTEQQPCAVFGWGPDGPSRADIAAAVARCHGERPVWQATRAFRVTQQRDLASWHRRVYRRLVDTPAAERRGA
jgi:beta-1,4-mannosyltransferase